VLSTEFLLTSLVVVLIPGTGVIYTVSSGLFHGTRASSFAALGCTLGILPHLVASLLGLAAVMHMSALAFQMLKILGVIYLFYLAWSAWHDRGAAHFEKSGVAQTWVATVWRGILLNVLNPKLTLFFLAFMPQFISSKSNTWLVQMLCLSAVFMAMTLAVFILYGILASVVRSYVLNSPAILIWMQRSFAVVFAALGLKLALSER